MAVRIKQNHTQEAAFGMCGTWSSLRHEPGPLVDIKKVHRIMQLKSCTLPVCRAGNRPRVKITSSVAGNPNQHWTTELASICCGRHGWCPACDLEK